MQYVHAHTHGIHTYMHTYMAYTHGTHAYKQVRNVHLMDYFNANPKLVSDSLLYEWIEKANRSINVAFTTLYQGGVWLTPAEASLAGDAGMMYLRAYYRLAVICHRQQKNRFPIMPKNHYLRHTFRALCVQSQSLDWVLNPLVEANQMDEEPLC